MKKETLINFYTKYKLFIFPLVVTLSSLILIFLVIVPQTLKLIANQKVGNNLLNSSRSLEVKAQTLDGLDGTDLSKKVEYALSVFPPEKNFADIVGIIQNISSSVGFSISSLTIGEGKGTKGGTQSFNVSVSLNGAKQLIPFLLSAIETAPRLMQIESFDISTSGEGVQINLSLSVLYDPLPKAFGSTDSPLPQLSSEDEQILTKLATTSQNVSGGTAISSGPSGPRGKQNPFE